MSPLRTWGPPAAAFLILSSVGCGLGPPKPGVKMSKDIDALSKIINLPDPPEEVWWEQKSMGAGGGFGPTDWQLVAVLRYRPEVLDAIIADAPVSGENPTPTFTRDLIPDGSPPEFRASLHPDGRDAFHLDSEAHEPGSFARSPLLNGYFIRAGTTDFLFLHLYTM
jgi:hypothetical protein